MIDANGIYSKHYFSGSQRIVSRVGSSASIFDPCCDGCCKTAAADEKIDDNFDPKKLEQRQKSDLQYILDKAKLALVSYKEYKPVTYEEVSKATQDDLQENSAIDTLGKTRPSPVVITPIYFYHPDHLGTSTFLTDANGVAYQFFLNLPFGATMAEQRPSTYFATNYKFNGKELDEETGLYYYGARYYDPRISIWYSVDPLAEKYPNVSPYVYCANNPILYTDPNGMEVIVTGENGVKTKYVAGMKYEGKDKFTSKSIETLNNINSTENGNKLLGELIGSKDTYNVSKTFAKDSKGNEQHDRLTYESNINGGGIINAAELMNPKYDSGYNVGIMSHELFHAYQDEKGQDGPSINNEVEAYLFGYTTGLQYNIDAGSGFSGSDGLGRDNSLKSKSYENAFSSLINEYSDKQFNIAVSNFQGGSVKNSGGAYDKHPLKTKNQKTSLIKGFYPLFK